MKKKLAIAMVPILVLIIAVVIAVKRGRDPLHAPARKAWKGNAIAELERSYADSNWLATETRTLMAKGTNADPDWNHWISPHLLLMKNSEWIVYASKCRKEDGRIHDILIGCGSDGKWYYSTYHFCIGMVSLMIDEQTESLASFIATYHLREFDGRSDDCLNKTWPPKRSGELASP